MRNVLALILDAAIVAIAVCCTFYGTTVEGEGAFFFCMYTRLSNILAAIGCLLSLPYDLAAVRSGGDGAENSGVLALPAWLRTLKLAGLATVMVTFLTVFCFLGFMVGFLELLQSTNFFFHLTSPLMMLVVCCFVQRIAVDLPLRTTILPILLTFAYALLYLYMVVFVGRANGGWEDYYFFNAGGMWPVSMVAMMAVAVVVSLGCWKLAGGKRRS